MFPAALIMGAASLSHREPRIRGVTTDADGGSFNEIASDWLDSGLIEVDKKTTCISSGFN